MPDNESTDTEAPGVADNPGKPVEENAGVESVEVVPEAGDERDPEYVDIEVPHDEVEIQDEDGVVLKPAGIDPGYSGSVPTTDTDAPEFAGQGGDQGPATKAGAVDVDLDSVPADRPSGLDQTTLGNLSQPFSAEEQKAAEENEEDDNQDVE